MSWKIGRNVSRNFQLRYFPGDLVSGNVSDVKTSFRKVVCLRAFPVKTQVEIIEADGYETATVAGNRNYPVPYVEK